MEVLVIGAFVQCVYAAMTMRLTFSAGTRAASLWAVFAIDAAACFLGFAPNHEERAEA